jgi:hypothetical protein
MTALYIGNVTKQIFEFAYRPLESGKIVYQKIPSGEQVRISPTGNPDMSPPEIDCILRQHAVYGLAEVGATRRKDDAPSGLIYSIGKPLTFEQLEQANALYEAALDARGKVLRQEAAVDQYKQLATAHKEQGVEPPRNLEMTVEELKPPKGAGFENHVPFGEGTVAGVSPPQRMR